MTSNLSAIFALSISIFFSKLRVRLSSALLIRSINICVLLPWPASSAKQESLSMIFEGRRADSLFS